jgi:histidinol-phosphate aminotransferase
MTALSRRAWLRHTGLGLGASVALPGLLPASEMARVLGEMPYTDMLRQLERDATAARRVVGPIRLCFNENPFGMSPRAKDALMGNWAQHTWYMPPVREAIRETFAKHAGVPVDHVLVTQGSSEVLSVLALAYGMAGGEIVAPWPTFENLPRWGDTLRATVHRVPLTPTLEHDFERMALRVNAQTRLVFVCNPNNPTSNLADEGALRTFVRDMARRAPVIVDEAYVDFVDRPGHRSMVDMALAGENVIISRTASKLFGLAGLRCGFAIARPDIIQRLQQYVTGDPNVFGLLAAEASLRDSEYQSFVKAKNFEGRTLLLDALQRLGRRTVASQTNFVFFHAGRPVEQVHARLLELGFLIGRPFPPYLDWARVSIGTPEEMQQLVDVLPKALA